MDPLQENYLKNKLYPGYSLSFLALAFAFGVYLTIRSAFYILQGHTPLGLCLAMDKMAIVTVIQD